ncbi:MAG: PfkB family carbohydrate kinase [Nocardioidaceae bacterium]
MRAWWGELRAAGEVLLSFDPNVRPALAGPHDEAVARVESYVRLTHVVKASDEDLEWLYPGRPLGDVADDWVRLGAELVVVTRGSDGCLGVTSGQVAAERPAAQVQVVDTIGAGDAFESGLLSGLVDSGCARPGDVAALSADDLGSVLDRATLVSGLTCAREAADPPTRSAYDAAASAAVGTEVRR